MNSNTNQNFAKILFENKNLVDLWNDQVKNAPDNVAVSENGINATFLEIENEVEKMQIKLLNNKNDSNNNNKFVALLIPVSKKLIVASISVLKSGKIIVPIDPESPKERVLKILSDTGNPLLLSTQEGILSPMIYENLIYLDENTSSKNHEIVNSSTAVKIPEIAYCLYTSGTTGNPKGVSLRHSSILNYLKYFIETFNISNSDSSMLYSNPGFDMSLNQIWPFLLTGGKVHIPPKNIRKNMPALYEWLVLIRPTVITLPHFVGQYILDKSSILDQSENEPFELTSLRILVLGGERFPKLFGYKHLSNRTFKILNAYGPTEATITTTLKIWEPGTTLNLSVGKPIPNVQVYISNETNCIEVITEAGITGEIYIGGAGICPNGYLNLPVQNKEAYVPNPLNKNEFLYRSRDIGFWNLDGELEIVGRNDSIVKIKGYRVDLGEIESNICKYPGVAGAVVINSKIPTSHFVAYVEKIRDLEQVQKQSCLTLGKLNDFLRDYLPHYALPSKLLSLDSFPTTPNGKIDRSALEKLIVELENNVEEKFYPCTNTEKAMASLWSSILSYPTNQISLNQSFYEIGGNSITSFELLQSLGKPPWNHKDILFSDIFQFPTLKEFTHYIENKNPSIQRSPNIKKHVFQRNFLLNQAQSLWNELRQFNPSSLTNENQVFEENHILFTGATGYFGPEFILQILEQHPKNIKIHCLIRALNNKEAERRLLKRFEVASVNLNQDQLSRLICIAADFRLANFGLEHAEYHLLTELIGSIIHCGANVHHFKCYEDMQEDNVIGTINMIKFALIHRTKTIHYISTLAVRDQDIDLEYKELELDEKVGPIYLSGYTQTKWMGEFLVQKSSKYFHIPSRIYRIGEIGSHSKKKLLNSRDIFGSVIRSFVLTQSFISGLEWPPFLTLDNAAEVVTKLTLPNDNESDTQIFKVYHVSVQLNNMMIKFGTEHGFIPMELTQWIQHASKIMAYNQNSDIFIATSWFRDRLEELTPNQIVKYLSPQIENTNTIKMLDDDRGEVGANGLISLKLTESDVKRYCVIVGDE